MNKTYLATAIVVIIIVAGAAYWYMTRPPEAPKEVVLTVPRTGDVMTLDPAESYSVPTHEVITPVYETLLRYDPHNTSRLIPCLAQSWEVSENGLSYIFHLRNDVYYTDGTKFNASCVIYSFNRTLSLGLGPAWVISAIDISKCSVIDAYTVNITLQYPYAPFIYALAAQWGPLIVNPSFVQAHATPDDPWAHEFLKGNMCGTGPYMLQEFVPGDHVTLVKNPNYWGGWTGNHVTKIYMPIIEDSSTRRLRLEQGSIDIGLLNLEDAIAVNGTQGIVVESLPSLNNLMIFINTQKGPLQNKLVRQALSYMFDYQGAMQTIRHGQGSQARGPLPRELWSWDPECPQYSFNLTKARELIEQAGFRPQDLNLEVWYVGTIEEERKSAELLQSAAAQIGVTITPRGVTWAALMDVLSPGSKDPREAADMSILYWYPDYADPDDYFSNMYYCYDESAPLNVGSYAFYNWGFYSNSTLNAILDEAKETTDFNRRVELYRRAQRIVVEDAPAIFLYDEPELLTYRSWVKGYYFNPCYVGCIDFYTIYVEGRP
jgi:peptide/nickel transport system substrate-binding protein